MLPQRCAHARGSQPAAAGVAAPSAMEPGLRARASLCARMLGGGAACPSARALVCAHAWRRCGVPWATPRSSAGALGEFRAVPGRRCSVLMGTCGMCRCSSEHNMFPMTKMMTNPLPAVTVSRALHAARTSRARERAGRASGVQCEARRVQKARMHPSFKVSQTTLAQLALPHIRQSARPPACTHARPHACPEALEARSESYDLAPTAAAVTTASSCSKNLATTTPAAAACKRDVAQAQPAPSGSTSFKLDGIRATTCNGFAGYGQETRQLPADAHQGPDNHAPAVSPMCALDAKLVPALNAASIVCSAFSSQIAAHKQAILNGSAIEVQSPGAAKRNRATKRLDAFLREQILAGAAEGQVPEALVTAAKAMVDPEKDGSISAVLKGISTMPHSSHVIEAMELAKRERAARRRRAFVQRHTSLPSAAAILRAEGHSQEDIVEFLPTAVSLLAARRAQKRAEAIDKHVGRIKTARGAL